MHRERRKAERTRALRVELDLARRSIKRVSRVGDVRDLERADPALASERADGGVSGGRMIEDRIERALVVLPGEEVSHAQALGELLENPDGGARLPRRIEDLWHQVQMGVGALAAKLLQPRGAGQDHVCEATRGVVHEQVVGHAELGARQSFGQVLSVREGGEHVGAEEKERANFSIHERFGDARHLVRDVSARWPPIGSDDGRQRLAVGRAPVARSEAAAGNAKVRGQRGKTADRAAGLPAVRTFVHRATAEQDHRRFGRRVAARERGDTLRRNTRDASRPCRRKPGDVGDELVESDRVPREKFAIVEALRDDDVDHAQRQRGVGPGTDQEDFIGVSRRLAPRFFAAARYRPVFGWLARFAPQSAIKAACSPMSSLVFVSSTPVRPSPNAPRPQQMIVGLHH